MEVKNLSEICPDRAAEICVQYKGLVVALARKFFLDAYDLEDLVQEGMIGLFKAAHKFDDSRGASFLTFATLCIKSEIINAIRKYNAQGITKFSIERDKVTELLPNDESDLDRLLEFSQNEERLRNVRKMLSEKENVVMDLYLEGLSYTEMAGRLSTNVKSVENTVKRIREKLKSNCK